MIYQFERIETYKVDIEPEDIVAYYDKQFPEYSEEDMIEDLRENTVDVVEYLTGQLLDYSEYNSNILIDICNDFINYINDNK